MRLLLDTTFGCGACSKDFWWPAQVFELTLVTADATLLALKDVDLLPNTPKGAGRSRSRRG